jgi:hypothetical protein
MLKNRTLFVVGAGASSEFGLPLGALLAQQIAKKLYFEFDYSQLKSGDYHLFSLLQQAFQDQNDLSKHLKACRRIHDGIQMARSIDNYIDTHRDDPQVAFCGKLAIADCILSAEKKSALYFDPHASQVKFDTGKLGKTWVHEFANILFDGVAKSGVETVFDNVSVVSFNYDRCIQQALILALHTLYHIDIIDCHQLVDKLDIVYPYGGLGSLSVRGRQQAVGFGDESQRSKLLEFASRIRTYSEQIADQELKARIAEAVKTAHTVVFLGCAFHFQNVRILTAQSDALSKRVLATAVGISEDGITQIAAKLLESLIHLPNGYSSYEDVVPGILGKQISLRNDLKCHELLAEYRHSLMK